MRYRAFKDGIIRAREGVEAERYKVYPRLISWWKGTKPTTVMQCMERYSQEIVNGAFVIFKRESNAKIWWHIRVKT